MGKFTAGVHVLLLFVVGHLSQQVIGELRCSTTGKNGTVPCVCNIMDACDGHGKARANWESFLPINVEQFGLVEGGGRNLAYLCEHDTVAILYDCNSRIPLYSATKITGDQLVRQLGGRNQGIRQSDELNIMFQQEDHDYENSRHRELRFKTYGGNFINDEEWLRLRGNPKPGKGWLETAINKGHLIAWQYGGRAAPERNEVTFTYTNVVPQFESFNGGQWRISEQNLIKWGQNYCAVRGAQHVEMFIIVGAIPSANFGRTRYFGWPGFSDYKDTNNGYRIDVPTFMWTAACCKYYLNGVWKYHNTAFYRQNHPGTQQCTQLNVAQLSVWLSDKLPRNEISLFPQTPQCKGPSL